MPAFSLSRRTGQVTVHSRVNDWMTLGEFLATGMFFSGLVSNLYIPSVVISQATPVNNLTTEQKPLRGRRNKSSRVSPQNIYEGPPSPPRLNLFFFFISVSVQSRRPLLLGPKDLPFSQSGFGTTSLPQSCLSHKIAKCLSLGTRSKRPRPTCRTSRPPSP